MQRLIFWTATMLLTGSICISGTHAQDDDEDFFPPGPGSGSVEAVNDFPSDDELEDWWPAMVPHSPYEGPLGQVDNREPHDACENCFTIPSIFDYEIFESVPIHDGATEVLIDREVANPAPLQPGEPPRSTVDADGVPIWYIGTQGYTGPQDTEPVSAELDRPLIELKRIKARHEDAIMAIAGVHGFGIVATGFGVWVRPDTPTGVVPITLEGIPVTVFVEPQPKKRHHHETWLRPVPVGVGIFSASGVESRAPSSLAPNVDTLRVIGPNRPTPPLPSAVLGRRRPEPPCPC